MRKIIFAVALVAAAPTLALAQDSFDRLVVDDAGARVTVDANGNVHAVIRTVPEDGTWDGLAMPDELREIVAAFRAANVAGLKQSSESDRGERGIFFHSGTTDGARFERLADPAEWSRTSALRAAVERLGRRVAAPSAAYRHSIGLEKRAWRELSFAIDTKGKVEKLVVSPDGGVTLGDVKKERFVTDAELARLDAAAAKADLPTLPAWEADDELLAARTSTVEVRSTDKKGASSRWRASLEKTKKTDRLNELLKIAADIARRLGHDELGKLAKPKDAPSNAPATVASSPAPAAPAPIAPAPIAPTPAAPTRGFAETLGGAMRAALDPP